VSVLKGEKLADLPLMQTTNFELNYQALGARCVA
jgi:hypothetical protein